MWKTTFLITISYSRAVVTGFSMFLLRTQEGHVWWKERLTAALQREKKEAEWKKQAGCAAQLCIKFNCVWL